MKTSQPVGNIQQEPEKKRATVIKQSWKDLNIRLMFDVKGEALGLKNTSKVGFKIVYVVALMIMFVACGTMNTIFFKFQNESYAKGPGTGPPRLYAHPFSQGVQMFIGMILFCLPLHYIKDYMTRFGVMDKLFPKKPVTQKEVKRKKKKATHRPSTFLPDDDYIQDLDTPVPEQTYEDEEVYESVGEDDEEEEEEQEEVVKAEDTKLPPINQLLFLIPSLCDLGASTLLYLGLIYTYASVYQMLRATVVVFTGILSVVFLKADIWKYPHNWAGVILIVIGTAIVGYSSIVNAGHGASQAKNPVLGALMVVGAQCIYAVQFVFEEVFLKGYDTDPLQVPGYEGYWGFAVEMFILFVLYWIPGNDYGCIENFQATIVQAFHNPVLISMVLILICNIGLYNFSGNWITMELSAATRSTIDCIRNVLVWIIQLMRMRQEFAWLQLLGFIIMVAGTFVYNQIGFNIICPFYGRRMEKWKKWKIRDLFFKKKDEKKGKTEDEWEKGKEAFALSFERHGMDDEPQEMGVDD